MRTVSIIVPIYKAEKYISRCIDSILSQTYKDIELLLIDDGSPDRSGEICEQYVQKDCRVKVYHKPNGGVSSARNYGIERATGDWIMFVDSDDWIEPDMLSSFDIEAEVDLQMMGYVSDFNNGTSVTHRFKVSGIIDLPLAYVVAEESDIINSPYCKLFKINNLQYGGFDERFSYGEDYVFVLTYMQRVNSCFVSKKTSYHYVHDNPCSLTNVRFSLLNNYEMRKETECLRMKLYYKWQSGQMLEMSNVRFFTQIWKTLSEYNRTKDKPHCSYKRMLSGFDIKAINYWGLSKVQKQQLKIIERYPTIALVVSLIETKLRYSKIKIFFTRMCKRICIK